MPQQLLAASRTRWPRGQPHFAAKANACIFLFMEGGPSHIDLFDPKPELTKAGRPAAAASFGKVFTPMGVGGNTLLADQAQVRAARAERHVGLRLVPAYRASTSDELACVRSCWADGVNHVGSVCQMNTGSILAGRPSLGAWVTYGLGTANQDLPAFVVMIDAASRSAARGTGASLAPPATFQGTRSARRDPDPPPRAARRRRRRSSSGQARPDRRPRPRTATATAPTTPELAARIAAYELAYRMQAAAPEAVDLEPGDRGDEEPLRPRRPA